MRADFAADIRDLKLEAIEANQYALAIIKADGRVSQAEAWNKGS